MNAPHLHGCPVPGCTGIIPIHFVMCRAHWSRVSLGTRSELLAALRLHRDGALSATDLARVSARAEAEAVAPRVPQPRRLPGKDGAA